jgi:hypothetical protein
VHTLKTDKQQRVRLPDAKPGQVFAYELDSAGVITLHQVKKSEPEVEILDLDDLDPKTLLPKDGSRMTKDSIIAAVRADREGKR